MTPRRPHPRRRGFTLMEVLATLVLIAIVVPVTMQGISLALNAGNLARRNAEAVALAEARLNELVASGEWMMGGLSGDFGPDLPDYRWTAEAIQREETLTELTIHVTWPARDGEREVALTTLVYTSSQ